MQNKIKVNGFLKKDDGFNAEFIFTKMAKDDGKGTIIKPININFIKNTFAKKQKNKINKGIKK